MTQNSMRMAWTTEEVDQRLHQIMHGIHEQCVKYGKEGNYINYVKGANVAGFMRGRQGHAGAGHCVELGDSQGPLRCEHRYF